MLLTERKATLSELLTKLVELCPDRISRGTFSGYELRVKGALVALRDDPTNPIDEALIIVAVMEEAKQREWFLEFSIDCNHYYSTRIEHSEGEVSTTDENPAVSLLQTLVKAIEL